MSIELDMVRCIERERRSRQVLAQMRFARRRRVIAQAQTGGMLYCERAIRADFARRHFEMATQSVRQLIAARQSADGRRAHTRHGSTQWLTGKHLIEIDNTGHVGQRHTQSAAHLGRNGFGNPAVKLLCGVQGRQKRGAALRREYRPRRLRRSGATSAAVRRI